jgi:phospholipid/cholesterol/gamma-HCH transport system permease protein
MAAPAQMPAHVELTRDAGGRTVLRLAGRLDSTTTGAAWREAMHLSEDATGSELVVDASGVDYCDGAGASLLVALRDRQQQAGGRFRLEGLRDDLLQLVEMVAPSEERPPAEPVPRLGFVEQVGASALGFLGDLRRLVAFTGELTVFLISALRHPRSIRGRDLFEVAEDTGLGAVPIIVMVGFLLGLILAFQSAIPMQRFGAEVFVADLLGISLVRVLGGLMTAVLLTARSGSAFAAAIGTMKVNEEIDALTTMGLEPVRFLVVPRVVAAVLVMPTLAMFMMVAGLAGGAVTFLSFDFPLVTYLNRLAAAVTLSDLVQGLFKAMVFGIVVAAVGCMRGLQTGTGAGAVGASATSAVVSGIVLIAFLEGVFSVVFYQLGI